MEANMKTTYTKEQLEMGHYEGLYTDDVITALADMDEHGNNTAYFGMNGNYMFSTYIEPGVAFN
jgi:hypothetical protein